MPTYSGLLARDNFQDDGTIPSTGDIWSSPDIIPYGTATLAAADAISTYSGPDQGRSVTSRQNNNIYVRCKNISDPAITGNVNLYYVTSSMYLYPTTWLPVNLPVSANAFVTATATPSTTIPKQAIAMTQSPFTMSGVPEGAHYCFIAVVSNNGVPFSIPASFASNAAFILWIRHSANVVQRNINSIPGPRGSVVSYVTFGNANASPCQMFVSIVGTNVPAGATWAASCADVRLGTPFSAGGSFSSSGTAGFSLTVPPNIAGGNPLMSMAFTLTNPGGQPFPPNTPFTISYYQIPTPQTADADEELLALERQASAEYRVASTDPDDDDGFASATLILLGSVRVLPIAQ